MNEVNLQTNHNFQGSITFQIPMCVPERVQRTACLLAMLGKWKSYVDKGKTFRALLTDLSKAFNCLSH